MKIQTDQFLFTGTYKAWWNFPFEGFSGAHGLAGQKKWDAKTDFRLKKTKYKQERIKHCAGVCFHSSVSTEKFQTSQYKERKNNKKFKKFWISCLAPLLTANKPGCTTSKDWKQRMPQDKFTLAQKCCCSYLSRTLELTIAPLGNILRFDVNANIHTSCQVSSVINTASKTVPPTAKCCCFCAQPVHWVSGKSCGRNNAQHGFLCLVIGSLWILDGYNLVVVYERTGAQVSRKPAWRLCWEYPM